jgi:hypothetical protein
MRSLSLSSKSYPPPFIVKIFSIVESESFCFYIERRKKETPLAMTSEKASIAAIEQRAVQEGIRGRPSPDVEVAADK